MMGDERELDGLLFELSICFCRGVTSSTMPLIEQKEKLGGKMHRGGVLLC